MPSARAELNARGSGRSSGSRELKKHLREQCARYMGVHGCGYSKVAELANVDPSQFGKFMRGGSMGLASLAKLEAAISDSRNDDASDLSGLADAIACRLLHGDGCISKTILTRYMNEVCR